MNQPDIMNIQHFRHSVKLVLNKLLFGILWLYHLHDMERIKQEESFYVELPKIYSFASEKEKKIMLNRNFKQVNDEVDRMIAELLGKSTKSE